MSETKHALYLVKDGEGSPKLFAAEDVEAAKANGWKEPEFLKSNGQPWNHEDDLEAQDAAADLAQAKAASDAKKADAPEAKSKK